MQATLPAEAVTSEPNELLTTIDHRPWPIPSRPWSVSMSWHDLLFLHWPVPPSALKPLLPSGLQLDTFEDQAWIGVVPFRMSRVRRRGLPPLPWVSEFPELNVRTYVRFKDKPGVWFFSLDAGSPVAVAVARRTFHLPYYRAGMRSLAEDEEILYTSRRYHRGAPPADFRARYGPIGSVRSTTPGSIEYWLTERYCLYAADRRGGLHRGEVHHSRWPLQRAEVDLVENTMAAAAELRLPEERPLVHFARRLDVLAWPLQPCA